MLTVKTKDDTRLDSHLPKNNEVLSPVSQESYLPEKAKLALTFLRKFLSLFVAFKPLGGVSKLHLAVFWSILEHMGHEEHGGTWHMEAAQLDTQRKKGEAILKTSSTVHSTNRSSSSTRPAKLQLDRAGSQSQTRKMLLPP
ncbi:unnamed protein product [Microthlaspi erraticum]|uniref:Uncharacterized protein n=1 Tax=Microthlaspi erraticum TaxID=1685480 RepID=A0A6D2KSH2_9BRAS|nr:unnamed protein product [Microthlaspi erraticum]